MFAEHQPISPFSIEKQIFSMYMVIHRGVTKAPAEFRRAAAYPALISGPSKPAKIAGLRVYFPSQKRGPINNLCGWAHQLLVTPLVIRKKNKIENSF